MNGKRIYVLGPLMGGFGSQAFLGQEISGDGKRQPVVMVFVPDEVLSDSMVFEQVLEENRIAVKLDHLNVITVYGLIKLEEGYARLVEFADAESLRSVFERLHELDRKMPLSIATAIVADACAGVDYAHEVGLEELGKPLLHEAIRPETMLVSFKGIGMVTGYGAATIAEYSLRARGNKASIRDPYTSPEQIFGGRKAATIHTDVYALGAVLFESLAGTPPFAMDASLPVAITNVQPPRRKLEGQPEEVIEIVMRALSKGARDRYHTPMDMRKALLETCPVATKKQVSEFMEELFPVTNSSRRARTALLNGGFDGQVTQPPPLDDEDDEEDAQVVSLRSGQLRPMRQLTSKPDQQEPHAKKKTEPAIGGGPVWPSEPTPVETPVQEPAQEPVWPLEPTPVVAPSQASALLEPEEFGPEEVTSELPRPFKRTTDRFGSESRPEPSVVAPVATLPVPEETRSPAKRLVVPPPEPVTARRSGSKLMVGFGLLLVVAFALVLWYPEQPKVDGAATAVRLDSPEPTSAAVAPVVPKPEPDPVDDFSAPVPLVPKAAPLPAKKPELAVKKRIPSSKKKKATRRKPTKRRKRTPRKKSITAMLGGNTGRLIVEAKPGSKVYIDGRFKGTLPIKAITLKAGPHKMLVKEAGSGASYRQTVRVKANIELTVSVEFY